MPMPVKKKFDSQAKTEQESQHNTTLYNAGRESVITYLNSPECVERVAKIVDKAYAEGNEDGASCYNIGAANKYARLILEDLTNG